MRELAMSKTGKKPEKPYSRACACVARNQHVSTPTIVHTTDSLRYPVSMYKPQALQNERGKEHDYTKRYRKIKPDPQ